MKLLEDHEIPLRGLESKQLPWTILPKILSEHGWELENWPGEVPLPGSGSQLCDDNKGIKGLNMKHLSLLYEAAKSEDRALRICRIATASGSSSIPMHTNPLQRLVVSLARPPQGPHRLTSV